MPLTIRFYDRLTKIAVLGLLICMSTIVFTMPAIVQAGDFQWYDGCAPQTVEQVEDLLLPFDYRAACETYYECWSQRAFIGDYCNVAAATILFAQCDMDDLHCRQTAMLVAIAVNPFGCFEYFCDPVADVRESIFRSLIDGIVAFRNREYASALEAFRRTENVSGTIGIDVLSLARSVALIRLQSWQASLDQLAVGIQYSVGQPLLWAMRAQVYGVIGEDERASLDAQRAAQLIRDPEARRLITEPLVALFPFDSNLLTDWLIYPVWANGVSPGGIIDVDLTSEPPIPVQLGYSSDDEVMFIQDLPPFWIYCSRIENCDAITFLNQTGDDYAATFTVDIGDGYNSIYLTRVGGVYVGGTNTGTYEFRGAEQFIIAPANLPADPRQDLQGTRCGIVSRLKPGMPDVFGNWEGGVQSFELYDLPNGEVIAQIGWSDRLTVLAQSECINNTLWWPVVTDATLSGWVRENNEHDYLLSPSHGNNQRPFFCPDAPPSQAFFGAVRSTQSEVALFESPDLSSRAIQSLEPFTEYSVIDGPRCVDGKIWWAVESEDRRGWLTGI